MKFTLPFITLSLVLVSCGCGDTKLQPPLTGTWVADFPNGVRTTMTVGPDGSYVGRIFEKNGSITTLEGKTQIKNGFIEDTCTKRNGTNVMVPCIERGRIIDMNACEIISTWEHSQFDTTTMRKVEK